METNQIEDDIPYYVDPVIFQSIPEQNVLRSDSKFEQNNCRVQWEHGRVSYQEELKTSQIGRMNANRYLIKMEYQDDPLDDVGDKDFIRPTIVEQVQMSYDNRQRIENQNFTRMHSGYFRDKSIYTQGM